MTREEAQERYDRLHDFDCNDYWRTGNWLLDGFRPSVCDCGWEDARLVLLATAPAEPADGGSR
jgi:hypothetical protein